MKKSFTMIELIFVIVILGILAAVAIPKLAATRDDAQTAALTTQVQDGTRELINYYTSQGGEINFSQINSSSQIVLNELINHGWVEILDDTHAVFYSDKNKKIGCISYETNGKEIGVEGNTSNNSGLCSNIRKIILDRNYSILNSVVSF